MPVPPPQQSGSGGQVPKVHAEICTNFQKEPMEVHSFLSERCAEHCWEFNGAREDDQKDLLTVVFTDTANVRWRGLFPSGEDGICVNKGPWKDTDVMTFLESDVVMVFVKGNVFWVDVNKRQLTTHVVYCEDFDHPEFHIIKSRQLLVLNVRDVIMIFSPQGLLFDDGLGCCTTMRHYDENYVYIDGCAVDHRARIDLATLTMEYLGSSRN